MTFGGLVSVAFSLNLMAADWNTSPAFDAFYNLDYEKAVALLEDQARSTPLQASVHNHLAQALLYRALFRAGTLDATAALSPARFLSTPKPAIPTADREQFHRAIAASLRLTETSRDAPGYYARGVAHIHRANFEMFVNKSWRAALRDATAARHLHQLALAADPQFIDAQLVPATHDYVVGCLPWYAKAIGFLAGIHGDKDKGMEGIRRVATSGQRTRVEATLLLALVSRREGSPAQAAQILSGLCRQFPRNFLYRMERIRSLRLAGDHESARQDETALGAYANLPPERFRAFLNGR